MSFWKNSSRLAPFITLGGVYLLLSLVLRLVLWWSFGRSAGVSLTSLPLILLGGGLNDLLQLVYLLLPLALYLLVLPVGLAQKSWHRRLLAAGLYLTLFGMLYLNAAEFFFFQEFDARFNLVAVDYLIYPHEVLINIWETYPVLPVLVVVGLLAAGLLKMLWPSWRQGLTQHPPLPSRLLWTAEHLGLATLVALSFSTDTLGFSSNRVSNELTANGISSLFRAFHTNELNYPAYYRTMEQDQAFALLRQELGQGGGFAGSDPLDLRQQHAARPEGLGPRNVVVIVEESMGAGFVGAYGDSRGLTPNFDRLSREGLLFANAYATGTRTVRGLEAISASFPPIPSESIVKRPGSEGIATWGRVMAEQGYQSSFLYGGYGVFDNMNHFFGSNGFALSDRSDIPNPAFANIWGVSDEDLLGHALDYFDTQAKRGQPFFSIIMSTSNHTPYTFPEGVEGVPGKGGGRLAGIRYADHALGRFFAQAPEHDWFANTVFVVVADHDARVYGRAQVPLKHYRIPLLVYAPGLIAPRVVETPTSQMDIAPTVLGLLGLPYSAPFFGEDVLHLAAGQIHPILVNHNHDVALLAGDRLVVLGLNRAADSYRYDAAADRLEAIGADKGLLDLATAYYQSAFDLFRSRRYQ